MTRLRRAAARRRSARTACGANVALAPLTTFRVGGPADWLLETRSSDEIVAALRARARGERAGDAARRRIERARSPTRRSRPGDPAARRRGRAQSTTTTSAPTPRSRSTAWCAGRSSTARAGLEAWAGTPGTVGGAIFGNAHFGGRLIGDLVDRRAARDPRRRDDATCRAAEMAFGYDRSRLQDTGEVLLSADVPRRRRRSGGAARDGARVAGVPQADAAARHAERRLRLSESRARARPRAGRHPVVGRRAGRSRRAQRARRSAARACRRRTATSSSTTARRRRADIRRLIERCRDGVRDSSASSCAKRSSTSATSSVIGAERDRSNLRAPRSDYVHTAD